MEIIKQKNMNTFSVTYISNGKNEGIANGKWRNTRRGKTFVTVITDFKLDKKQKKKVTFQFDSENIQKPKASKIAVFSKKNAPNIMRVKTNEEIEKEDMEAALTFLRKKTRKKGAWKPSFLRNITKPSTSFK